MAFIKKYYADSKSVKRMSDDVTETTCITPDVLGYEYQKDIAVAFEKRNVVSKQSKDLEGKMPVYYLL